MPHATVAIIQLFDSLQAQSKREKLCTTLRQLIRSGMLTSGERLPSSRLLASDLALSRITVEAAYAQLESEGYLQRQTGKGTFVSVSLADHPPRKKPPEPTAATLSARGNRIVATGGCQDPLFPQAFAAGSPDLHAFPHAIWRRLVGQRLRHAPEEMMRYGHPQGLPLLQHAVARYLAQSRGVRCEPEQVMILTSSQQALQMLALLLCDAGDTVWLEEPGYSGARNAFISAGANVIPMPLDEEGATIPDKKAARMVYLTPSHQYPTGVAMTLQRRLQWLALARREGCWLLEDDYDSEFYYQDQPMPALQGLDDSNRVLYLGTFSKVLFPSLRLAYLVVPPSLVDPLSKLRSVMDGHSAQLMQAVTADFINNGHFQAHLRLMRKLYASRRALLLEQLASKLGDNLVPLSHSSGLQLAVTLPKGGEARLTEEALQRGIILPRLSPLYSANAQQEGWILGFSALQRAEIIQAVEKLAKLRY
ncbi:Transcriptional regulator, GntR family [Erwinia billingiae Eb661]|uniref:Transcriptional regulator, GntR family n=1 Tax=Erwinia billingiae (strain Eb661) TaxID=634500 RepID=D8MUZ2_ERWBE|nr:PLP-dependent aminotransferase family protein [Erwinia billingiae]CAX60649.1 Transcriptional regulator, GntR family [Erwinia billingiae Eb661]